MLSWLNPHYIDSSVYDKANQHKLGIPIKKYQKLFIRLALILSVCGFVLSLYNCVYSLHFYQEGQALAQQMQDLSRHCTYCSSLVSEINFEQETTRNQIWQSALVAILMLFQLWLLWTERKDSLYLCEKGLLLLDGRLAKAARWDEIVEMVYSQWVDELILHCSDDHTLRIPPRMMRKELSATIEREVCARLLPPLREQYAAGATLPFKDVVISQQGVWLGRKKIAWDEIEQVQGKRRYIVFKIKGQRKRISSRPTLVRGITNVPVCAELIKSLAR